MKEPLDTAPKPKRTARFLKEGVIPMKKDHIDWLREQLAQFEKEFAQAEADVQRLQPVILNLKGTLDALAGSSDGNGAKSAGKGATTPFKIRTLKRNPKFESFSTIAAAKQILDASDKPIHHDDLTKTIFQITDDSDFTRAKRALTSQLSAGAQKHHFKALGNGLYGRAEG
jgi:hypothetical protein